MDSLFKDTYWITVIILWTALIFLYFILTNRKSLERKGHHEKYITYLRKSHRIRIVIIAVLMPLLILLSGWIIFLLTGSLTEEAQLAYIVVVLILLVIPFKIVDERINQKKIRELALETSEKIAVDLNYKALHLIFHPVWELILAPLALLYGILYLEIEQWVVYLFLLIPWFMYFNIRGTRYQTRPYLKDNYKYMFAFTLFNFLFFLVYFCAYFLLKLQDFHSESLPILLLAGFLLILGLVGRVGIYLANYKAFNQTLAENQEQKTTPFTRKLIFVAAGYFLLFSISGISLATGLIRSSRLEVGVVKEKILIHTYQGKSDTLTHLSSGPLEAAYGIDIQDYPGELRMECVVRLSTTHRLKTYNICCPAVFEELPLGRIVKFEYGAGNTMTKLVAY
jgi:hypothetical protein